MKKNLDFICIGAAKSATTTFFELVKDHPQIYIPDVKEAAFFSNDKYYKKGLSWYMDSFFPQADENQVAGTITPQYMTGTSIGKDKTESIKIICDRIKSNLPNVKIIVLLRHPIERSYSHHKMRRRQNHTKNSFEEDVSNILKNKDSNQSNIDVRNSYLFGSEYGRILSAYYDNFSPDNILVLYTDDLKHQPQKTLDRFFRFLNVDTNYSPPDPKRVSHKGGSKTKIKYLTPGYLRKNKLINSFWNYIPPTLRKKIYRKINLWNVKPDSNKIDNTSETYQKLVEYFRADIKILEELTNQKTPWEDWS